MQKLVGSLIMISIFTPMAMCRSLTGTVLDMNDKPIQGALVISSGVGFRGWGTSDADGHFTLNYVGAFVTVRHKSYRAVLTRFRGEETIRIHMEPADESVRSVPSCNSVPYSGYNSVGVGL